MNAHGFQHGIRLFNARNFYDAHEVWEDVWRETSGPEKLFLQGLIQVAVALHHHSTGNVVGARSLLERARRNLAGYPGQFCGISLTALLPSLAQWSSALALGAMLPEFPRIEVSRRES